jgi:hypothetical protein
MFRRGGISGGTVAFTKKFTQDPLRDRCYLLVHSDPKVGKTKMVLDLVRKHGHFVVMLSFDAGTFEVRQSPEDFEGKLAIASPLTLSDLRDDMHEASSIVSKLARAGVPKANIWVCVDTLNALQTKLMVEARKINVKNPETRDSRKEFVRDATTEVDYNINLAHMGEVADWLAGVQANVIVNCISKEEYVERRKTGRVLPAITGQSATRFSGDADAILFLNRDKEGRRWIECDVETGGDRSGHLATEEPADLIVIRDKMLGRVVSKPKSDDARPTTESSGSTALAVVPKNDDAPAASTAEAS